MQDETLISGVWDDTMVSARKAIVDQEIQFKDRKSVV